MTVGLFHDRFKERAARARHVRRVERMRGVSPKVRAGRSVPDAPPPYICGARCGHPDHLSCPSTVRGGVCPCRYC